MTTFKGHEMDLNLECTNVNECATMTHMCDQNAECLDTDGSFECFCNYGFGGDGLTCVEGFNILDFVAQTKVKMMEGTCLIHIFDKIVLTKLF